MAPGALRLKSRRTRLFFPAALLLTAFFAAEARSSESALNVVIILADDMAWTDFGFMGNKTIRTPNLDKLAAEGAVFPNAYVPTPLCRASHASLLTGLYAHEHRVCTNQQKGIGLTEVPTLSKILTAQGYEAFQAGKFWEGTYADSGFTHGVKRYLSKPKHLRPHLHWIFTRPLHRFLDRPHEKPFFIFYAPTITHVPHKPRKSLLEKYLAAGLTEEAAAYAATCESLDEQVGGIVDSLSARGLRERTLIVFAVDNGWSLAPKDPGKGTPYDLGLRFPLLFVWPGHVSPGRYEEPVLSLDVLPTILELAGLEPPPHVSGVSLAPRIRGGSAPDREAIFGEIYRHTGERAEPELHPEALWARSGKWKIVRHLKPTRVDQLFDLEADPFEKNELSAAHPEELVRLRALLDGWADSVFSGRAVVK